MGGLSTDIKESDLSNYFCKFGKLEQCIILKEKLTMKSRGFGFIIFTNEISVKNLLSESNCHFINGKKVECKQAVCKDNLSDLQDSDISYSSNYLKLNNEQKNFNLNFNKEANEIILNNTNIMNQIAYKLSQSTFNNYSNGISNKTILNINNTNKFDCPDFLKNHTLNYVANGVDNCEKVSNQIYDCKLEGKMTSLNQENISSKIRFNHCLFSKEQKNIRKDIKNNNYFMKVMNGTNYNSSSNSNYLDQYFNYKFISQISESSKNCLSDMDSNSNFNLC